MTTLVDSWPEPSTESVAQRLRSYMGDKKISRSKLALAAGLGRTQLGAKLDGNGEFTVKEIVAIGRALGRSWLWVMTGDDSVDSPPPPEGEGVEPPGGIEPPTYSLRVNRSTD